jgi:hypothetical protein
MTQHEDRDDTRDGGRCRHGAEKVMVMEFQVCRRGREARWVVTLGNTVDGAYLDKEQALLDAVDAARDALAAGNDAQVWVKDRATTARVF